MVDLDEYLITDIPIIGSHNSAAFRRNHDNKMSYIMNTAAYTQTKTFLEQYQAGVRFFDLRINEIDNKLYFVHNIINFNEVNPEVNRYFNELLEISKSYEPDIIILYVRVEPGTKLRQQKIEIINKFYDLLINYNNNIYKDNIYIPYRGNNGISQDKIGELKNKNKYIVILSQFDRSLVYSANLVDKTSYPLVRLNWNAYYSKNYATRSPVLFIIFILIIILFILDNKDKFNRYMLIIFSILFSILFFIINIYVGNIYFTSYISYFIIAIPLITICLRIYDSPNINIFDKKENNILYILLLCILIILFCIIRLYNEINLDKTYENEIYSLMTRELGQYQTELHSSNGLQVCNKINSETIEEKCSYNNSSICGDDDRINRRILEQDLSSLCTGTATFEDIPNPESKPIEQAALDYCSNAIQIGSPVSDNIDQYTTVISGRRLWKNTFKHELETLCTSQRLEGSIIPNSISGCEYTPPMNYEDACEDIIETENGTITCEYDSVNDVCKESTESTETNRLICSQIDENMDDNILLNWNNNETYYDSYLSGKEDGNFECAHHLHLGYCNHPPKDGKSTAEIRREYESRCPGYCENYDNCNSNEFCSYTPPEIPCYLNITEAFWQSGINESYRNIFSLSSLPIITSRETNTNKYILKYLKENNFQINILLLDNIDSEYVPCIKKELENSMSTGTNRTASCDALINKKSSNLFVLFHVLIIVFSVLLLLYCFKKKYDNLKRYIFTNGLFI